tara:strand:- start:813 stop:1394 length:582 start_codon:yes stop_codon:yes gene_type:complete
MDLTEDKIKNAAETEHWVESRIIELEEEIERLKSIQDMMDAILRKTSFQPATDISKEGKLKKDSTTKNESVTASTEFKDIRPLKRSKDDLLLANMYVSESAVAIIPVSDITFNVSTPPFSSFLLNRIFEGMKFKDQEKVSAGEMNENKAFSYDVEKDGESIKKIIIKNYRDQSRITEIFNTSAWTFTRMLEKT